MTLFYAAIITGLHWQYLTAYLNKFSKENQLNKAIKEVQYADLRK